MEEISACKNVFPWEGGKGGGDMRLPTYMSYYIVTDTFLLQPVSKWHVIVRRESPHK